VIPKVEIPILWAGDKRGVVCPPTPGMLCDIEYYDGDPDYPRISNFRWPRGKAPSCELDAFIIQQRMVSTSRSPPESDIFTVTAQSIKHTAGVNFEVDASSDVKITAGGKATINCVRNHQNNCGRQGPRSLVQVSISTVAALWPALSTDCASAR
jgi:uncharacterized protein involved in type VI secretion and phage assembly